MRRLVRCTFLCHCHQKCQCRNHLLYCLQSNGHPILYHLSNVYFATSAKKLCGCNACGGGAGSVGGVVCLLHMGIYVIGAFCFAGFISSSGNCCWPLNGKGKSSLSVFLIHPEVQWSVCVSNWSVLCLYW